MIRRLLLFAWTMAIAVAMQGQNDDEQVLVFRHSGEVNLFYAAQLDSIVLSEYDADSVCHEEVVSQVFYAQDTTMVVPIAEIDSVAFGNRNVIEMRAEVKEMTAETDLPWIIRFDSTAIHYRLNTPENILPKTGQKLFYGLDGNDSEDAIFPYGLTARVTAVTQLADEIQVDVEMVELSEIFSKLFYAGRMEHNIPTSVKSRRIRSETNLGVNIPIDGIGDIDVGGTFTLDGPVTFDLLRNYINIDFDVEFKLKIDVNLQSDQNKSLNYESFDGNYRTVATLYRVLNIGVAVGAFADLAAELTAKFGVERTFKHKVKYLRQGDEGTWTFSRIPYEDNPTDNVHAELILSGSVYYGPIAALQIATAGELFGARAKLKFGPKLEGEISAGFLRELRTFNPDFYAKGKIEVFNCLALEGYIIHRRFLCLRYADEHKVFESKLELNRTTWDLFPEYKRTLGVAAVTKTNTEVSVATHVDNEIIHEVETGFEIVDAEDNIIDSIYVDVIKANEPEVQGVDAVFELPKQTESVLDSLRARPVFHYAGYTIRGDFVPIMHDSHLQPIIFYGTNGVTTYIAGASVVDTAKVDSTVYHIGNYLPVPVRDSVFIDNYPPKITPGNYINTGDNTVTIIGNWRGEENGNVIEITFNDDEQHSGDYNINGTNHKMTYELNTPQSGKVCLLLDDQTTVIFSVVTLTDTTLIIQIQEDKKSYTLYRQY